jgi:hypothetical protein
VKANLRFWVMVLALTVAAMGMQALSHGAPVVLSSPLKNFPLEMDTWHGSELPLDAEILKVAAVDDYLNRMYRAPDGRVLGLYIGYYKSQQT